MMSRHESSLCSAVVLALSIWPAIAQQPGKAAASSRTPGPALEVRTAGGKVLKVHEMRGRVIVVDFMTTVCPTCKVASAGLQRLYRELGPKGFCPIAVALNLESEAPLKDYEQEHGLTFHLGMAPRADAVAYLSHPADKPLMVPTLVLLDRKGRIFAVEVGWKGDDAMRAKVLKLLAE